MHQVSSRLSKLALSVMLAFALVPTASVAAMADPQISDPASDPIIQSPSIDQGVSEEAPASTESWQGEGSEPAEADETAQPDSEAEASAAALAPDRQPVGFVYFDESSPSAGGSQLVVVALDDESIELTSAELTLTAPSGASVKATASEYAGNAALFSVDVPEAGEYRLERMEGASAADSRTLLVDLSSCEGEPYAFMVAEPQAEAFSLSDESTGGVSVYALTDDGQLEEASSFEEAAQLSAEAAPAVAGRSAASGARSPSGKFVVALDPGHGGSEPGASANGLVERELTWKIALYCKEALESYANVEVVLTRGSDEKVSLVERVNRAVDAGANVFVSLHLNSGPASGNGAEVWYPNDSSYRHELHEEGAQLSSKILEKLTALGLTDRGIKVRDSERVDGEGPFYYPDGSIQDYYTVIEASREAGIVGIIVEHAFLSNKSDSDKLKSEAFLKELGYADAEGIAETYKLSSGWEIDNGRWKLKLADGTYATSSWQQVKGKKYWFGADSYAVTGWQTIDEKRYYFDSSCALRTDGWLKDDGSWYWLSSSGVMQTGWLKLGGTWYWLDPQTGKMATGWTTASDGHRYYFDGSGAMQTGWAKVGGTWYYLSGSGAMHTGWLDLGGKRYYLSESGAMVTGKATIEGETYRFDSSGALLPSDSIMGPSLATVEQMVTLFNAQGVPYPVDKYASRGAATIKDFCQVLLDQARSEDVRAEVLFAQAMVETGWLQFGGDVDRNGKVQCNFGGLGATGNGVAGEEFPDVKTGLLAQAQHLKGYASTAPLNQSCVDTRFGLLAGKRGSAPTVDKLSGTWAADKTYGTKVMNVVDKLLGY